MTKPTQELMHCCLYFTANALSRKITRLAEQAFHPTGLSPSHAFLVMLVVENKGIAPTELSQYLSLAPSTITRLVDSLENRGFLERTTQGKAVMISATDLGKNTYTAIGTAWKDLYERYSSQLGRMDGDALTRQIDLAVKKLT